MHLQNRLWALILRCIMLIACGFGLAVFLGLSESRLHLSALVYYTILSNLICFIFYLALTFKTIVEIKSNGIKGATTLLPRLKGAFIMMITVTFLVYLLLLSGDGFFMAGAWASRFILANHMLHYVAPILILLDWLLFDPKRKYRWFDPLLWLSIPILYFCFALIRAEIGGNLPGRSTRYPYYFIDVDAIGWSGVLVYAGIIAVGFVALGYLFLLIDQIPKEKAP